MPRGILAFWGTLPAAHAADFDDWYNRQHLFERTDLPGFRSGQRYRSGNRFFAWYETDTPEVLASRAYLARLNAPTAWTRRVMPHVRGGSRGIFRVTAHVGRGRGGVAATMAGALSVAVLRALVKQPGIVAAWQWQPVAAPRDTVESRTRRTPDRSPGPTVLIEATDRASLAAALRRRRLKAAIFPLRYAILPTHRG